MMGQFTTSRQSIGETTMEGYDYRDQRERLLVLAARIASFVNAKDRQYGSSWRRRGGTGAFMVIARKWDRIEEACKSAEDPYDIFECFATDLRKEGITDDVVDLVGYLLVLLEFLLSDDSIKSIGDGWTGGGKEAEDEENE